MGKPRDSPKKDNGVIDRNEGAERGEADRWERGFTVKSQLGEGGGKEKPGRN